MHLVFIFQVLQIFAPAWTSEYTQPGAQGQACCRLQLAGEIRSALPPLKHRFRLLAPYLWLHFFRLASMLAFRSDSPPDTTSFASLVFPTTDSNTPTNAKTDLAKTAIEWLIVVIAVVLIACLFLRKMFGSRASQRGMLSNIPDSVYRRASSSFAPAADSPSYLCTYVAYPGIPAVPYPLPVHLHPRTARTGPTRGLDIDEGGRRVNEDVELVLGDKDVLPAYDGLDRPPKYVLTVPAATAARPTGAEPT
ncbi:hypothetical protein MVEN_01625100 [Mycena venus]|uniref:Uncharacterized protein n=1 Tax=Mycena venus TaxID=2733690 RepID=A0A8H7CNU9_9AGAR|nr:hypothetical protein MVEN_01625100 [Mycena venus]